MGISRPQIVASVTVRFSGGSSEILASQWKLVAEKLKNLCSLSGFKADPSRTADAASILRPVGTHNRKYDPPRQVKLFRDASAVGASAFEAALDRALERMGTEATTKIHGAGGVTLISRYVEPERVSEGGRNNAVLRHVGHLRGNGVAEILILGLARNFNAAKCVPPLDDDEVARIVKTYASQGNPDPDDWPEPQEIAPVLPAAPSFDFDMLPEVLKDFVRDASERMGVPLDYLAVPLVLSAAASLGSGWAVCPKASDKGWKESPVLWGGIVAPPGSKKSPCLQLAAKPLQRIEAKLAEKYRAEKESYDLERRLAKSGDPSMLTKREPKQQRAIVNDVTYQKLAELCSTSAHGLLAQSDEISGMLGAWTMKGQEAARGFYLTAWSGDQPYVVDRKETGTTSIDRLSIVISGGVQPSVLAVIVTAAKSNGAANDGLIQRFQLFVYPDPHSAPAEADRAADLAAQERAWGQIERLRDLTPSSLGVEEEAGTGRGILHFDAEAQAVFDDLREKIKKAALRPNVDPLLAAHLAKMAGAIAKIAMLIHLLDGGTGNISLSAMEKAARWSVYMRAHARRIYALWRVSEADGMGRILSEIKGGKLTDGFTARDVARKGWHGLKTVEAVDSALNLLVQAGWLRTRQSVGEAGGRPTVQYIINPKQKG